MSELCAKRWLLPAHENLGQRARLVPDHASSEMAKANLLKIDDQKRRLGILKRTTRSAWSHIGHSHALASYPGAASP